MMNFIIKGSLKFSIMLLLFFIGKECYGSELRCYICDNCKTITKATPMLECNADYFNTVGAVMPSTMVDNNSGITEKAITVPTEGYMKTMTTASSSKANPTNDQAILTTTLKTTEPIPSPTTPIPTSMADTMTEEESPKASTVMTSADMLPHGISSHATDRKMADQEMNATATSGTTSETTTMKTVMGNTTQGTEGTTTTTDTSTLNERNTVNEGLYQIGNTLLNNTMMMVMMDDNETDVMAPLIIDHAGSNISSAASPPSTSRAYMNSSTFRSRQSRHVMPAKSESGALTYHCYTAQTVVNSTLITRRGCARIKAMETVCGQLKQNNNPGTPINECRQCSTDRCNGSSALNISMTVILMALVAILLKK